METIASINGAINGVVWGLPMLVLLVGAGIVLTIMTAGLQFRKFGYAMKNTGGKIFTKVEAGEGEMTPFQAMSTALASTVGTGNIAGITTALVLGGEDILDLSCQIWLVKHSRQPSVVIVELILVEEISLVGGLVAIQGQHLTDATHIQTIERTLGIGTAFTQLGGRVQMGDIQRDIGGKFRDVVPVMVGEELEDCHHAARLGF